MNARFILLFVLCLHAGISSGEVRTFSLNGTDMYYHFVSGKGDKAGLLIFLHGAVKAFAGQEKSSPVPIETLLEGNAELIPAFTEHGYDIILPVCHNEYNWLDPGGSAIIDTLLGRHAANYSRIYLAGFSDGGTGAYKYFYTNPEKYSGLIIINGYPQYKNFYRNVNYKTCTDKTVIFSAQGSDKVVPYEFLLTEYRRQKMLNKSTYFKLGPGKHELVRYTRADFESYITLLEQGSKSMSTEGDSLWIYPPLDAYMPDERLLELYHFRSKVAKGYGMRESEYRAVSTIDFDPARDVIRVFPLKIARTELEAPSFDFPMERNGQRTTLRLPNYMVLKAW